MSEMQRSCGCTLVYIDLIRWHSSQYFGFTAYLAPGRAGLAQEDFSCVCTSCQLVVTREKLAVAKFVNDLVNDPKNLDDVNRFGDAVYLP